MADIEAPKILARYSLTPQQVSDAVSDYVREMVFPDADEIDCGVRFTEDHGARVEVYAERRAAIPEGGK